MHFGKIVKETAQSYRINVGELAWLMGKTVPELMTLLDSEEWTSGNIKAASDALNHDFGTYLNHGVEYDFVKGIDGIPYHDLMINIKYPIGKESLFEAWKERMWIAAQNIGLETGI